MEISTKTYPLLLVFCDDDDDVVVVADVNVIFDCGLSGRWLPVPFKSPDLVSPGITVKETT